MYVFNTQKGVESRFTGLWLQEVRLAFGDSAADGIRVAECYDRRTAPPDFNTFAWVDTERLPPLITPVVSEFDKLGLGGEFTNDPEEEEEEEVDPSTPKAQGTPTVATPSTTASRLSTLSTLTSSQQGASNRRRIRKDPMTPSNPLTPEVWRSPGDRRSAFVTVQPVYDHSMEGDCHVEPDHELEYVGWAKYRELKAIQDIKDKRAAAALNRGGRGERAAARNREKEKTVEEKEKDDSLRRRALRKLKAKREAKRSGITWDEENWVDLDATEDESESEDSGESDDD
ncbi:hypothetical protein QBC44DRAFT_388641 [Cladorrhinum sp. PSN332]|nr:hypothetical protein QBC44DRAFT_388641 [Cladorrhinum sp. PSN332]